MCVYCVDSTSITSYGCFVVVTQMSFHSNAVILLFHCGILAQNKLVNQRKRQSGRERLYKEKKKWCLFGTNRVSLGICVAK